MNTLGKTTLSISSWWKGKADSLVAELQHSYYRQAPRKTNSMVLLNFHVVMINIYLKPFLLLSLITSKENNCLSNTRTGFLSIHNNKQCCWESSSACNSPQKPQPQLCNWAVLSRAQIDCFFKKVLLKHINTELDSVLQKWK